MDFVEGNSLKQILQTRHSLPPWQVLMIALGVLDVLLYLHAQSPAIVHRDIKPDNIKVHRGRVYLLDFGLAKDMLRGTQVRGYTKSYSSPEQEMGESTDARSDIYSLGAMLHHILTGAPPPDALVRIRAGTGLDPLDMLLDRDEWIARYDPAASDQLSSKELPPGDAFNMYRIHFAYVIDRALALDPDRRFESANEMLKALAVVMHFEMEFLKTLRSSRRPVQANLADLES